MADHFNLTQEDFAKNKGLFEALEIRSNDVVTEVGKNYKELSDFLKKRHRRLILTYHPDKGEKGDAEKFREVHKAYGTLQECIKPLESGKPCTKASVGAEGNGLFTKSAFHYRRKLFEELRISEQDIVGKTAKEILLNVFKVHKNALDENYTTDKYYYHIRCTHSRASYKKLYQYLFPNNAPFNTNIIH